MLDGLNILYLEDEPLVAMDTGQHLQSLGFSVVEVAYRLEMAEAYVTEVDFHLALLDINVDRGQTSFELGARLAEAGVKVIFASGNSTDATELQSKGYGFLDKPFSLADLTKKLETVAAQQAR